MVAAPHACELALAVVLLLLEEREIRKRTLAASKEEATWLEEETR